MYSYDRRSVASAASLEAYKRSIDLLLGRLSQEGVDGVHREFLNASSQFINLAGTLSAAKKGQPEYRELVSLINSMGRMLTDGRLNRAMQNDDQMGVAKLIKSMSGAAAKVMDLLN